ncbi:hypothetical protein AXG93_4134s1020 [Marchantia polymorpha subsp. ruderalis]|uniref:Uncharacterized protein n=1 Tax=Marchantia polymorpha subsp. ruderalis TaxID=1480154 RepID=A0A176VES6_MARPO|nr:hypothetical protein AXG93_4134s1020 [Marchantia polymorpha subsp. ruderalis]
MGLKQGVSLEKNLVVKENWDWVLKHSSEMVMELRSFHWEEKLQVLMDLVGIEEESGTWEAMEMSIEEETRGLDLGENEVTDLEDKARTVVEEVTGSGSASMYLQTWKELSRKSF